MALAVTIPKEKTSRLKQAIKAEYWLNVVISGLDGFSGGINLPLTIFYVSGVWPSLNPSEAPRTSLNVAAIITSAIVCAIIYLTNAQSQNLTLAELDPMLPMTDVETAVAHTNVRKPTTAISISAEAILQNTLKNQGRVIQSYLCLSRYMQYLGAFETMANGISANPILGTLMTMLLQRNLNPSYFLATAIPFGVLKCSHWALRNWLAKKMQPALEPEHAAEALSPSRRDTTLHTLEALGLVAPKLTCGEIIKAASFNLVLRSIGIFGTIVWWATVIPEANNQHSNQYEYKSFISLLASASVIAVILALKYLHQNLIHITRLKLIGQAVAKLTEGQNQISGPIIGLAAREEASHVAVRAERAQTLRHVEGIDLKNWKTWLIVVPMIFINGLLAAKGDADALHHADECTQCSRLTVGIMIAIFSLSNLYSMVNEINMNNTRKKAEALFVQLLEGQLLQREGRMGAVTSLDTARGGTTMAHLPFQGGGAGGTMGVPAHKTAFRSGGKNGMSSLQDRLLGEEDEAGL
jgi:hypothetical protein